MNKILKLTTAQMLDRLFRKKKIRRNFNQPIKLTNKSITNKLSEQQAPSPTPSPPPPPKIKPPKCLKFEQLVKLRVQDIVCRNGISLEHYHGHKIELEPTNKGIALIVDNVIQPIVFPIAEQRIKSVQLRRCVVPYDRQSVYYVIMGGKRYRYLYLHGTHIGTRDQFRSQHGAFYTSSCRSHRQRRIWQAARKCCSRSRSSH